MMMRKRLSTPTYRNGGLMTHIVGNIPHTEKNCGVSLEDITVTIGRVVNWIVWNDQQQHKNNNEHSSSSFLHSNGQSLTASKMTETGGIGAIVEEFSHPDYQRGSTENSIPITCPVVVAVTSSLMKDFPVQYHCEWHSEIHSRTRETMKQCILHLISQRKANPSPEWLRILPEVCSRVEEQLYYSAIDFEEYNNPHTLLDR